MRNILAIAGKELRAYFASPIGYVLIGFFALLFGYFFYAPARLLRTARACRWAWEWAADDEHQPDADRPAADRTSP